MSTKTLKAKPKAKKTPKLSLLRDVIVEAVLDKKAEETVSLDLRKTDDAVADFFIICHATSRVQVKAIAENVIEKTRLALNEKPLHSEGFGNSEWVVLDYFDVVVHIFLKEKREFYQLEDLWHDAKRTEHV